ncbi:MAG TPA: hypothetical protein VMT76_12980 [Puia sp.]|nr:hypothetical protein [Puia sp.]
MKKIIVLLFVFGTIEFAKPSEIFAQKKSYSEAGINPVRIGSIILNAGAGVGANYREDYYYSPFGLKASLELGLWHTGPGVITLGPELGVSFSSDNYYGNYNSYHSRTVIMAARSAWHYGWKVKGLDTYGGLSLGVGVHHYDYHNGSDTYYSYNDAIPVLGAYIGASYFTTPTFGLNAEAGYDITNFQLGVVFKLK